MNLVELQAKAGSAEGRLKAMASGPWLMSLCELVGGERTVTELHEAVQLSMSAVSQHLAKLREADVVTTRRDSQTIRYSLAGDAVAKLLATLHEVYCAPDGAKKRQTKKGKLR